MAAPNVSLLHVYGQLAWHDEVYLVGNRRALEALRDALTSVLDVEAPAVLAECEAMVNDGEAFDVVVIRDDAPWEAGSRWMQMAVPYTAEYAEEKNEQAVHPWGMYPPRETTPMRSLGEGA